LATTSGTGLVIAAPEIFEDLVVLLDEVEA